MKPIKRAVIALDLSDVDAGILRMTNMAKDLFGLHKLYFVHIIPNFATPTNPDLVFHAKFSTDIPVDEAVKQKLELEIDKHLKVKKGEAAIEVIEGKPYQKLAHWAEVKNADLLVFGKKKKSSGSGITARRAARQVACNLFLIPENPPSTINRILVPMDFSDNSVRALEQALRVKKQYPKAEIQVVHLIRTFTADHYYGLSQAVSYWAEASQAARKAYDDILKKLELPEAEAPIVFLDDHYGNVFRHLWEYAEEQQPDLVIMGAQGHSAVHHFLYGSVTEDFVDYCEGIPMLIVR
jgi:nucleotide-binding universal stress UspA family protein